MSYRQDLETGEYVEVDAQGNPVSRPPAGGVYNLPNPARAQSQANENARLDLARQAAARAAQAASASQGNAAASLNLQQTKFLADLEKEGKTLDAQGNIAPIPGWMPTPKNGAGRPEMTAAQFSDAIAQYNAAQQIEKMLVELRQTFARGQGKTSGAYGVQDFLPTEANKSFDKAAGRLRAWAKQGTGTTGGENNSLAEMKLNLGSYIPDSWAYDETNRETMSSIEGLAQKARQEAIQRLGGVPDANGRITPVGPPQQPEQRDPLGALYLDNSENKQAVPFGGTEKLGTIPPGMQAEYEQWMGQNAGRLTPDSYAAFRSELDQRYGYGVDDIQAEKYREWARSAQQAQQKGGTLNTRIPPPKVPMSQSEIIDNSLANNPAGAAAAGFGNMMSMGGVSALAGDQYEAIRNSGDWNGAGMMAGEIGGAILGTKGLGMAGRGGGKALRAALPSNTAGMSPLVRNALIKARQTLGGPPGTFGKNLAVDTAYGAGYGGVTEGDPLRGAAYSAIGSTLGQGIGAAGGRAISGVTAPVSAARNLHEAGITLSPGQILRDRPGWGGKAIAGIEDRLADLPVIGDMIGGIRTRGIEDFNRVDMNRAIAPVGGRVTEAGQGGYAQADQAVSDAYGKALGPMRLQPDQAMQTAMQQYPDYAPVVSDQIVNGYMTGEGMQAAKQILSNERRNLAQSPGGYGQSKRAGAMLDEMTAMADRQAPDLMGKYRSADEAFAALRPIREAVAGAVNNRGIYTPAQKGIKLRATDQSAGKRMTAIGARPGQDLQADAQSLLPSTIPNSGTVGRALVASAPLAAFGAQEAGIIDPKVAALLALMSTPYTKTGQKAAQALMLGKRPQSVKALGEWVRKKKGLFGSALVPFALEAPQ
jgi:hypothetical protein